MGFTGLKAREPLQGGSLLLTTTFSRVLVTLSTLDRQKAEWTVVT